MKIGFAITSSYCTIEKIMKQIVDLVDSGYDVIPIASLGVFTREQDLIALVGEVMPVFMIGMLIFGLQNGIQPTFVALGQAKISLFIAVLRKIILLIPLAIILPHWFGVWGVYYAEPVSDILSATTATTLFAVNIKRILGSVGAED